MSAGIERTVDDATRRITITVTGRVTDDDVRAYFARTLPLVDSQLHYDRLLDLTDLEGEPSIELIREVADAMKPVTPQVSGRYAIVAPRAVVFGMMRMLEMMVFSDADRSRVFRSVDVASAWLSLPRGG